MWISGDTVLYDGVREVANRFTVDVALLHLGAARFPQTGSIKYTMTAQRRGRALPDREAADGHPRALRRLVALPPRPGRHRTRPRRAPDEIRRSFRVLTIGDAVQVGD